MSAPCPACGEPVEQGEAFCESCGVPLTAGSSSDPTTGPTSPSSEPIEPDQPTPVAGVNGCRHCGAPAEAVDAEGYCSQCGLRQAPSRDHQETDLGTVAAVSDRGHRHRRNEDAYAIMVQGASFGIVVCDGVSSSPNPDDASLAAATAAIAVFESDLQPAGQGLLDEDQMTDSMARAVAAAQVGASGVIGTESAPAANPSTTLVAALVSPERAVVANIGDSRAYFLTRHAEHSRRLTVDDSWAEEAIAAGVPADQAYRARGAHVITRWLGADAEAGPATTSVATFDEPGLLLVCSDGLWNYFETPEALTELAASAPPGASPLQVARHLVDAALAAGGDDNVTVAVASVTPPPEEAAE